MLIVLGCFSCLFLLFGLEPIAFCLTQAPKQGLKFRKTAIRNVQT
jgi:hypothetical protein